MIFRKLLDISNVLRDHVLMPRPSGRGGARPGAGRKRLVEEPERVAIDIERSDLDTLREVAEARGTSVAALIRKAISQYLTRLGSRK